MENKYKKGGQIYAVLPLLILMTTTIIGTIPVVLLGLLKLIPNKRWQDFCTRCVDVIATNWCSINNFYVNKIQNIQWEITGLNELNPKDWYLIIANHQSWLDIVILQKVFNRKIPVLKFFIKDQLKWVPVLGLAWWAMGCPFMKRYSKEYLAKYPHKQGQDLEATINAIDRFKRTPAAVMSFIEGTRFTQEKKQVQNSPHKHLLRPKAGGISFILSSMGEQLSSVLDVTIVYPQAQHSLWDFLCKRIKSIKVHIRQIPIPSEFTSKQLLEDTKTQADFKDWLNQQWANKDNLITSLKY
ncbi:MAG: acyltransferase [Legionella sp.]|jgi:1-acyl-sn-glycerol-3-phosphate acyltransferase